MRPRELLIWIGAGVLALALLAWAWPRAFPFAPREWSVSARDAEAIALERLRDLGDPVADPYLVVRLTSDQNLERRLQLEAGGGATASDGELAARIFYWEVAVYAPGARVREWTYRARIGLDGKVLSLQLRLPEDQGSGAADPAAARREADLFLAEAGFDLAAYEEPEVRTQQLRSRTETMLRYPRRRLELGPRFPYGVEVRFSGERLSGFQSWFDDPDAAVLQAELQPLTILTFARNLSVLLLLPLVAVPFLRRYHAGEIGVRRGLQIGAVLLAAGVVLMATTARPFAEGAFGGTFGRQLATWAFGFNVVGFFVFPAALVTFLSWSVGESLCRERWTGKIAAFDALLKGAWTHPAVARSSLRAVASGAALAAGLAAAGIALQRAGVWPIAGLEINPWMHSSHWAGLTLLLFFSIFVPYGEIFGRLFLVPWLTRRLGLVAGGSVAALVAGALCFGPTISVLSLVWFLSIGVVAIAVLVVLFLRYDLLTSLGAAFFSTVLWSAYPMITAEHPWVQLQGMLAALGAALPLIVSVKSVGSAESFEYRYDDVPPHVRRIAERERQRLELETARRIQSSILPHLPSSLNGVGIAHSYLPATEVGGDFYDVMALDDGRLAVAVGDVAGHGVSSGLVMSMAKSALSVQVGFDPEVDAVLAALNRVVYESARKRLLTTLCYVLLDPARLEMRYASAGHLFPYRLNGGRVSALESISYPLGVRRDLEVAVQSQRLDPGDRLVLFSDGVVEARREGSEELFGFDRLERSLRRHGSGGPEALRDGVLADLEAFAGPGPREDDLTLVVLELPG